MNERSQRVTIVGVTRLTNGRTNTDQDLVAAEAPVTIELRQAGVSGARSLGVLMRTPGDDEDLVLGLLHGEGIILSRSDVREIRRGPAGDSTGEDQGALLVVELAEHVSLDGFAARALTSTTACGLCGRLAVQRVAPLRGDAPMTVPAGVVAALPDALRARQSVFAETGGLHAAGLFDASGTCLAIREDVGRHNAVDKVLGATLASAGLPATEGVLVVSGRVAFEIVQKTVVAGIPMLVAVGAPSSLAVDAARAAGVTLVGFVRQGRFNVYTRPDRVR